MPPIQRFELIKNVNNKEHEIFDKAQNKCKLILGTISGIPSKGHNKQISNFPKYPLHNNLF